MLRLSGLVSKRATAFTSQSSNLIHTRHICALSTTSASNDAKRAFSTLPLTELTAISPIDGRYGKVTEPLRTHFSEFGLIKQRVFVELRWLQMLSRLPEVVEVAPFSADATKFIQDVLDNFSLQDAERVKEIERITRHDVKAVEYFLKEKFSQCAELNKCCEFLHFSTTSEDVNNLAYALMIRDARKHVLVPKMTSLLDSLCNKAEQYAHQPMLSRTHGQPATPTTVGKELANHYYRLSKQFQAFEKVQIQGKINGAVGNYNAQLFTYPTVDWEKACGEFVEKDLGGGLEVNLYTTQIEPHDYLSELFHSLHRFNTILIDLDRDLWGYISLKYFKLALVKGEIGSSTMPHKINPIDFENSEGNAGMSNSLYDHLCNKLLISRFQRDLSDSTVLRTIGVGFGHSLLAYQSCLTGLQKIEIDQGQLEKDLNENWEVLAEPIQTVMRRHGVDQPYERLKELTRGKAINHETLKAFIHTLELPKGEIERLLKLTPLTYLGHAAQQAMSVRERVKQMREKRC